MLGSCHRIRPEGQSGRPGIARVWLAGALIGAVLPAFLPAAAGSDLPASTQPAAVIQRSRDWPMWGGGGGRNMVSLERGLPAQWDVAAGKNVKWVADLGSRTYGNLGVSGSKVFIGTNNGGQRNPKITGDQGVMMCFAEPDGRFCWQAVHGKLPSPNAHDWPEIGVCSTPCVVGDRLYYVSNRCELICADTEGFGDNENDGPFTDETSQDANDADFVWRLDMRDKLGVVPLYGSASSPLVLGDLVLVVTGNGAGADAPEVPAPQAPSFLAVDRATGKVAWSDNSPGDRIIMGQWSSPACGTVNGKPQVVFPGGDGWLYAFEPATGRLIWKLNCKAHETPAPSGDNENENTLVATPVFYENKVFIALGGDPGRGGSGPGCLLAVDATGTGDVTHKGRLWHLSGKDFGRSVSTVAVADGLLYAVEMQGYLNCLDATTGKRYWRQDLKAAAWASPLVADGKVYVANEDGDVFVLKHGKQAELLAVNAMNEAVYGTAVAANGVLYIAARTHLYAIAKPRTNAADWPMARGNPQLTGVASAVLPADLQVRWKHELPDVVESSAAIAGGIAYLGCYDGFLYALDLTTGAVKWKYDAAAAIRSSPCVANGTVFFGDSDGVFHAIDSGQATAKWTFRTQGEIISSANYVDGKVLFGSYDGCLYCLSANDGRLIWKTETEGRVHGTPGVTGDSVLVAGCDEQLHVFRLADGFPAGTVNMGSFSGAAAAICGSRVFVGTFNNQVIAVDWVSNRVAWTYEHPDRHLPFYGSAAVTDELVVIGGRDKLVHALDARTGKARWTFAAKDKIDASPVIVGGRVFIGAMDGNLYALDLASGKQVWRFEAGSPFTASPAVGGGSLIVATEDGMVYCFGSQDHSHD